MSALNAVDRRWLTLDPTVILDYENDRYESATIRLTYGHILGKIGKAVLSGYVRPGVGIGDDRPNDWSFEAGMSSLGSKQPALSVVGQFQTDPLPNRTKVQYRVQRITPKVRTL